MQLSKLLFSLQVITFVFCTDSSTSYGTKLNIEPVEQQHTKHKTRRDWLELPEATQALVCNYTASLIWPLEEQFISISCLQLVCIS